jgi:uncharacterized UPF0160 family protein
VVGKRVDFVRGSVHQVVATLRSPTDIPFDYNIVCDRDGSDICRFDHNCTAYYHRFNGQIAARLSSFIERFESIQASTVPEHINRL